MPTPKLTLASEVKYLKGVGPARAEILASRGIRTVEDLLYYSPFRYEDRTRLTPIRDLVPGQTTTVLANVLACGLLRTRRGLHIYDLRSEEHTSELQSRSDLVCRLLLEKKNRLVVMPTHSLNSPQ